jgi:hypothetical protein
MPRIEFLLILFEILARSSGPVSLRMKEDGFISVIQYLLSIELIRVFPIVLVCLQNEWRSLHHTV